LTSNSDSWNTKLISDVVELKYGKGLKESERERGIIPVYGSKAKIGYHNKYLVKGPGIIIGRKGNVGFVNLSRGDFWPIDTTYYVIFKDKEDYVFWYYLFQTLNLNQMNSHSAVPGLNKDYVYNLKVKIPEYREQQTIAKILSDLDEKIEVNNQMNKTLEEIAQAIFKSWFIDFEFPNENGDPYKSSGGEMVESELGMIPRGWKIGQINSLADVLYGAPLSSGLFNTSERGIPIIRIRDLEKQNPNTYTTEKVDKKYLVRPGEILVGMDGEFRVYVWRHFEALLNQRICKFIPKNDVSNVFLFFSLQEPMNFFERSKVGTTVIHLGKTDIDQMRFFLPPEKIMSDFKNALDVIFNKIVLSSLESKNLSKIRDLLLPKLMTGKIRVPLED